MFNAHFKLECGPASMLECIKRHISFHSVETITGSTIATTLATVLFASKKTRACHSPTQNEFTYMVNLLERYVRKDVPIEAFCPWGVAKGYSLFPDRIGVDISDLLAMRRFAMLQQQIKHVYSPGIQFNMFQEDVTEWALNTRPETLAHNSHIYRTGLQNLASAMGITLNMVTESGLLAGMGVTQEQFMEQAKRNKAVFEAYWWASDAEPDQNK